MIEVQHLGEDGPEVLRYELRCNPPAGSVPHPERACDAIDRYPAMTTPPEMTGTCAGDFGIPPGISVEGVVDGVRIDTGMRGCDQPEAIAKAAALWQEILVIDG